MVLIAACALRLAAYSQAMASGWPLDLDGFVVWLAGGTLFTYHYDDNNLTTRLTAWLGGCAAIIAFFWMERAAQVVGLGAGLLWACYARVLRGRALAKPLLVALVWVLATHVAVGISGPYFWPICGYRFCLVLALALAYDLVDMRYDAAQKTATIPLKYGKKVAVIVAFVAILGAIACDVVFLWANAVQILGAIVAVLVAAKWEAFKGDENGYLKMGIDAILLIM
jgi:4-hydroxybenzoate polyprenyltransferase